MEKHYVGRVDGNGTIYRFTSRAEAVKRLKELQDKNPGVEFYHDGPSEKTLAEQVSDVIEKFVHENSQEAGGLIKQIVRCEDEEERDRLMEKLPKALKDQSSFVVDFSRTRSAKGLFRAVHLAEHMGMPGEVGVAICVEVGFEAAKAMREQAELKSMMESGDLLKS